MIYFNRTFVKNVRMAQEKSMKKKGGGVVEKSHDCD